MLIDKRKQYSNYKVVVRNPKGGTIIKATFILFPHAWLLVYFENFAGCFINIWSDHM